MKFLSFLFDFDLGLGGIMRTMDFSVVWGLMWVMVSGKFEL